MTHSSDRLVIVLLTLDFEILILNLAGGRIQLMLV